MGIKFDSSQQASNEQQDPYKDCKETAEFSARTSGVIMGSSLVASTVFGPAAFPYAVGALGSSIALGMMTGGVCISNVVDTVITDQNKK